MMALRADDTAAATECAACNFLLRQGERGS